MCAYQPVLVCTFFTIHKKIYNDIRYIYKIYIKTMYLLYDYI
jgi:hypothetical protein